MYILKHKEILFDDFTINDDGSAWSQICKKCQDKLAFLKRQLDDHGGGCCGILGCDEPDGEYTIYVDFPEEEFEILEVNFKKLRQDLAGALNGEDGLRQEHLSLEDYDLLDEYIRVYGPQAVAPYLTNNRDYYNDPQTNEDFIRIAEDVYGNAIRDNSREEKIQLGKQYHETGEQ